MKKNIISTAVACVGMMLMLPACTSNDNTMDLYWPTALVTVCPNEDGSFVMQLDNETKLVPTNLSVSPFGKKEVRALVNYTETVASDTDSKIRNVQVNWLDSIRTKLPVESLGSDNDSKYGNDPIEIVNDWVTIAEDGYLTLRIRTLWGMSNAKHVVNLLTGTNPADPCELEIRHDAQGDIYGHWGDALIAFNLNNLPTTDNPAKIKLKWRSFSGDKTAEFDLQMRQEIQYPSSQTKLQLKAIE